MSDLSDDKHLDVCNEIEVGLIRRYRMHPRLTDMLCMLALDNAKIATKQACGFAKNESFRRTEETAGIIDDCVALGVARIGKVNDLTLKEYLARIDKIRRSVARHHALDGTRGYYNFIQRFFP